MKFRFTGEELDELEEGIFVGGWASEVRDIAIECGVNPVTVYVLCLGRRLAQVPPSVCLPALGATGGTASLNNMFLGVADSGGGKNVSLGLAEKLAPYQGNLIQPYQTGVGTGEAMVKACVNFDKDEKGRTIAAGNRESVVATITEARAVNKELKRDTSKAAEVFCDLWSGAYIGPSAAGDPDRKVDKHATRWVCTLMTQPANLGGFASQLGTGLPQRITWLPAVEPRMPDEMPQPLADQNLPTMPRIPPNGFFKTVLPVDASILQELWLRMRAFQIGEADEIDGQRGLVQEKLAAAIALSEAHWGVTEDHWLRAAAIMRVSDATRERALECYAARAEAEAEDVETKRAALRAHSRAIQPTLDFAAEAEHTERFVRMRARALEALASGAVISNEELRRRSQATKSSLDTKVFRSILAGLENDGVIERDPPGKTWGGGWRLVQREDKAL